MRAPVDKPTIKQEAETQRINNTPVIAKSPEELQALTGQDPSNFQQVEASKKMDSEDALKTVKSTLSEYLNAYIFLGYDINGTRIVVKHTESDLYEDSIIELLRFVFMRIINGS